MYVYISSEPQTPLWTVGHYAPDGKWIPESDHGTEVEAAARVHYLNGGEPSIPLAKRHEGVPSPSPIHPLVTARLGGAVHTPGPWRVGFHDLSGQDDGALWIINADEDDARVVVAGGKRDGQNSGVTSMANARLIALAPTAPHECDPSCPGEQNRQKLESAVVDAADEVRTALANAWREVVATFNYMLSEKRSDSEIVAAVDSLLDRHGAIIEDASSSHEDTVDPHDLKDERDRLIAALAGLTVMGRTDDWNIVVGPVGWGNAQAVLDDMTGRERKQEPEPQEGMARVEFDRGRMYVGARDLNEQYAISRYTAAVGWQIVARFASGDEADRYARDLAT